MTLDKCWTGLVITGLAGHRIIQLLDIQRNFILNLEIWWKSAGPEPTCPVTEYTVQSYF